MNNLNNLIDTEFERIQQYDYNDIIRIPSLDECIKEWNTVKETNKSPIHSPLIKRFHLSKMFANRHGQLSPYFMWEEIKKDKNKFAKLLKNRCTYNQSFIKYGIPKEIPLYIYAQGMQVMRWGQEVSYFKPALARDLIKKWLPNIKIIIDPFSGYSGRMLGAMAAGCEYVGSDICEYSINESQEIYDFIKKIDNNVPDVYLEVANAKHTISSGYDALFTCPPYADIESWPGVNSDIHTCDEWIDICISNNKCKHYLFVVDDTIKKYRKYIIDEIHNKSHFGSNVEYIIKM